MAVTIASKRPFAIMNEDSAANSGGFIDTGETCGSPESSKSRRVSVEGIPRMTNTRGVGIEQLPVAKATRTPSGPSTSPQTTPAPAPLPSEMCREFKPDASVVLIGLRGTGKSTLAVIASMACRRRVVEVDSLFEQATGFSTAKYRKQFGAANHNLRQDELLRSALHTYDTDAIIVCNGGSLERNGQLLMQDFARTHPVVHVVRDLHSVHDYLEGVDLQRLRDMMAFSAPILRRCSNYEFYNLSETNVASSGTPSEQPTVHAFLTLQKTQRTFLKFLSLITPCKARANGPIGASIPPLEPGYPLSDVATELRKYTCAVQVSLDDLLADNVDIGRLEYGCDVFEIVVDPARHGLATNIDDFSNAMSRARRSTIVPIVYQVVPTANAEGSRTAYLEHVQHGFRMVPEYVAIDLTLDHDTLAGLVASRGITKIIGCLHTDRPWEDTFWVTHYEHAMRLGCAVVRFSRPAVSVDDDDSIQRFRSQINGRENQIPLVCFNTGHAGRRSQCFNRHLTPVVPDWKENHANETSTTWLTAREITKALYASFTFDPMQLYIIGASLEYTVSPAMHNAAYESCGMPHQFNRISTASSLDSLRELIKNPNFGGSIVIQPYKVEVMSLADSLSQHARAIGAVNTLIPVRHLKPDGSVPDDLELFHERCQAGPIRALHADNTEWIGIRSCVRRGLSPANAVRLTTCGLIIGAGGMARAAVYALLQLGVRNMVIFNRTYSRAENLVTHFSRLVSTTAEPAHAVSPEQEFRASFHILKSREDTWPEAFRDPTIILSCIPTDPIDGGPAAQFTLPPQWVKSPTGGVVMETAYKTLDTPLAQQVRNASSKLWTYMDGLDFIPEQAFAQFELFTGRRAPRRVMREEVLRAWRDDQGNADAEMVQKRMKMIGEQEPLAH
ncbi:quinate pathway repressor protein-like protein QutR [Plenodomus tracheiphilus IPT5]|uniref:Quinate pathway repressor protein-like protein QutR n=1 Tax=Plenodomus tracheiphilus IPT5 TaxID=1408161 RepID=A0A6A7BES2_9PLEO|nr:quinate pathway repressor protein-like protein QutR [Plenodomus tracheiphilus IPT5]